MFETYRVVLKHQLAMKEDCNSVDGEIILWTCDNLRENNT
jgi:hypothetical protein